MVWSGAVRLGKVRLGGVRLGLEGELAILLTPPTFLIAAYFAINKSALPPTAWTPPFGSFGSPTLSTPAGDRCATVGQPPVPAPGHPANQTAIYRNDCQFRRAELRWAERRLPHNIGKRRPLVFFIDLCGYGRAHDA